jgi:hypothetical protein
MTTKQKIKEMISIYNSNKNDINKMHKKFNEAYSLEDCLQLLKHQTKIVQNQTRYINDMDRYC